MEPLCGLCLRDLCLRATSAIPDPPARRPRPALDAHGQASHGRFRLSRCLDAKQRQTQGGVVQTWACDPTNLNQLWHIDVASGLIKNRDGICLDHGGATYQNGGSVFMWACDPTDKNQRLRFDPATGQIRSDLGGCLDASERQTNGGKVIMWPCSAGNVNQQWMARAVEGKLGELPV